MKDGRTEIRVPSVAARGFARADAGLCHEICLCVVISGRAALRNASAAAGKTSPGIAAPAGVPRPAPPNWQAHLPRHARSPHRTPPASAFGEHVPGPGYASPPSQNGTTAACHTRPIAQGMPWKYVSGCAYRTIGAGVLRGLGWAASPNQQLVRIYRMAGCEPRPRASHLTAASEGTTPQKARLSLGRSQEPVLGQLQRLAPPRAPPDANWQRPAALP